MTETGCEPVNAFEIDDPTGKSGWHQISGSFHKWEHSMEHTHINTLVGQAHSKLAFLERNLRSCPQSLKDTAYKTLVRQGFEYASAVWDHSDRTTIKRLDTVQRHAIRFVHAKPPKRHANHMPDVGFDYVSVSALIEESSWPTLESRRRFWSLAPWRSHPTSYSNQLRAELELEHRKGCHLCLRTQCSTGSPSSHVPPGIGMHYLLQPGSPPQRTSSRRQSNPTNDSLTPTLPV